MVLGRSMGISHAVFAQSTTLDLTTPTGDKISGGDKKGTLDLVLKTILLQELLQ